MNESTGPSAGAKAIGKVISSCADFFWDAFLALHLNGISGDYAEFGCNTGGSFVPAHDAMTAFPTDRHMWAFDSWQALPDDHPRDAHPAWALGVGGAGIDNFHAAVASHGVPRNAYTSVEGYYSETLPALGTDGAPTDIALAYIDCDLYSSTVTVLEFLAPRLKHGMIVAFDDYFCWSPTEASGERVALDEFLRAHPQWRFSRYRNIHWAGLSFVVEQAELLPTL